MKPMNLADLLSESAGRHPDKKALVVPGSTGRPTVTYKHGTYLVAGCPTLDDVAMAMVWVEDDQALNTNEAYAFASCSDCVTRWLARIRFSPRMCSKRSARDAARYARSTPTATSERVSPAVRRDASRTLRAARHDANSRPP